MAYKVVLRRDVESGTMLWEPGCPVLIKAVQVSRDTTTGTAYLQGRVQNISNDMISSFELRCVVDYEQGEPETVVIRPLDADLPAGAEYTLQPQLLRQGDVTDIASKTVSAKVGAKTWESKETPEPIAPQLVPGCSADLSQERAKRMHEAGIATDLENPFMPVVEEDWWQCACGQLNTGDACVRCKGTRENIRLYQKTSVLTQWYNESIAAAAARKAEEDRLKAEKEEREAKRKAELQARMEKVRKYRVAIIAVVIVAIVAAGGYAIWDQQQKEQQEANAIAEAEQQEANAIAEAEQMEDDEWEDLIDSTSDQTEKMDLMYRYVVTHKDKNNKLTDTYVRYLVGRNYEGAKELREEIFG